MPIRKGREKVQYRWWVRGGPVGGKGLHVIPASADIQHFAGQWPQGGGGAEMEGGGLPSEESARKKKQRLRWQKFEVLLEGKK